jgi:sterol 24-C-methyltransferase
MPSSDREPLIKANPSLHSYYTSLESRIGYRLFLGGTYHFGYYPSDTYWPFPIDGALRAMEDHLYSLLKLPSGARVLDAGCGMGHVAMHLARRGLFVQGIDIVDHHVLNAKSNIKAQGLEKQVSVRKMDYHHLDFPAAFFSGVYTMETFVHATDPQKALGEFFRVLKPGGTIAMYEYDHSSLESFPKDLRTSMNQINKFASMPSNELFDEGVLQGMLEETGFVDVLVRDLSENIRPLYRLFFVAAFLPYLVIWLFGLQAWFVNTVAAVEGYRGIRKGIWRYIVVTARKPDEEEDVIGGARGGKKPR